MPFAASDAHRHKKGLSAKQARQWAAVANSVRGQCLDAGGSEKKCDAAAVIRANGAVGKKRS